MGYWDTTNGEKGKFVVAEFYDNLEDPHEFNNLATNEKHRPAIEKLSIQLKEG